ncbi:uncharacterized protein LOC103706410 [Phoenix dactylifera]|uniref:50S ribosomal protein L35 n=1 Tax=Phoenix dactylifera TaxID=42345 RepID=A0A8B7BZQ8_PHODC|nr:uncharacterized protein LOC103706410 [Phoenix dactylifera]
MQRWCIKLGRHFLSSSRSALRPIPPRCLEPVAFPANTPILRPVSWDPSPGASRPQLLGLGFFPPSPLLGAMQARHYAAKERSRAPITPATSKVKKYKLKAFSSFKFRFRTMKDGKIRRWRAGKRHNAHLKTKKAKRRLRKPGVVHAAYAKVIKKLNFCG